MPCSGSASTRKPRRWVSTCPSTVRSPIRCDVGASPPIVRFPDRPQSTHIDAAGLPPPAGVEPVTKRSSDRSSRGAAPLYEARFEHDACGVGFVADAGGRSRERVLPLALAGLAALAHRGAFGADGESSDGAGVSLPLDRSLLALLAGPGAAAGRPGIVSLFLPRGR